jgi:tetratricopeptide (TPR) repeat protein
MSSSEKTNPIRARMEDEGVPPPPRLLLWSVIGIFIVGLIGAYVVINILQNGLSLSSLLELGITLIPIITLGSILAAVLLRKSLPRRVAPGVIIFWVIAWVIGGTAFILIYRNTIAPGQRETVKHYLPFMVIFSPPLPPPDSSLPTPIPNEAQDISPSDLLNSAPLLTIGSPQASTAAPAIEAQPTSVPTQTEEVTPTATPTEAPAETTEPTQAAADTSQSLVSSVLSSAPAAPPSAHLYGFTVVKQGWNECGPANITMALSYYGWKETLDYASAYLKPDREDKNVNPWELVSFVNEKSGVRALTRVGGDMALLKQFLAHNIPVIIETGYMYEGSSWLGHYQTVVGYDNSAGVFYIYDTYLGTGENGTGMPRPFADFDQFWEDFNRTFIVLYKQEDENTVRSILGDRADVTQSEEIAADTAQEEAKTNPQNAFAWFNLGSSLAKLGQYDKSVSAYDEARRLGTLPWRITLYQFGPFEAYYNVGRYSDVQALIDAAMNNGGEYVEEIYYWQGQVYAAEGDKAKAASAYRQALNHNPKYTTAQDALNSLNA